MKQIWSEVVSEFANSDGGLTVAQLSTRLGHDVGDIEVQLRELRDDGVLALHPDRLRRDGNPIWIVVEEELRPKQDQRFLVKERKCLTCAQMFMSQHAGNRICPRCSASDIFDGYDDVEV